MFAVVLKVRKVKGAARVALRLVLLDVLVIYSFNDSPVDLYLDFSRFINNFIWNDNNITPCSTKNSNHSTSS
jgi:hypothetical protein